VSLLASLDSVDLDVDAATLAALPAAPLPWEVRSLDELDAMPLEALALSALSAGLRLPRAREATEEAVLVLLEGDFDRGERLFRLSLETLCLLSRVHCIREELASLKARADSALRAAQHGEAEFLSAVKLLSLLLCARCHLLRERLCLSGELVCSLSRIKRLGP